ncbi:tryptophan synthase beta subunit-like PLP-dependent enzyme, partial [Cadophora sp. DSE1049]
MADPSTCPPLTAASIAQARKKIVQYINRTHLITSESLNQLASSARPSLVFDTSETNNSLPPNTNPNAFPPPKFNLYFKCENLQRTGAFKARGAFHALSRLIEDQGLDQIRRRGVTTASSGNHAQGLALAAATFDVPAFIVMPKNSTRSKVDGGSKGEIIFCGSLNEEKKAAVEVTVREKNCLFVPPYNHPDIILGQGTCALELEEQFLEMRPDASRNLDAVIAPIGGGGLLGGLATWFGEKPATKVFGAEPSFQGADDARRGLLQNARIEHVASSTIADGLRTPVGEINWKIVSDKTKVEGVFSVGEDEIKVAMRIIYEELGMLVEPSGCVPLAVVLFNDDFRAMVGQEVNYRGGKAWNVVIVFSGGNTTMEIMQEVMEE